MRLAAPCRIWARRAFGSPENIKRLSGDKLQIKFYEPGALVPALECFDAASKGSVESCWTTPGYHTGKLGSGVAFFTAVPFGPPIGEFLAWKWHGGGNAIRDKKYAEFGLMAMDCFCIGAGNLRLVQRAGQQPG